MRGEFPDYDPDQRRQVRQFGDARSLVHGLSLSATDQQMAAHLAVSGTDSKPPNWKRTSSQAPHRNAAARCG